MVLTTASPCTGPSQHASPRHPRALSSRPAVRPFSLGSQADTAPSQRDGHIRLIREQGRSAWREATEYGKRSLVETAIGRYQALIGPRLRARTLANQQGEVALGSEVLNRMIRVAKPISVRIA